MTCSGDETFLVYFDFNSESLKRLKFRDESVDTLIAAEVSLFLVGDNSCC